MIEFIKELSEKRKRWIKSNEENGFQEGIENLLTELYPSDAHFIYELLQNAEDAQAEEVHFKLYKNKLEFKHNGKRNFTKEDIDSITSIGKTTKKNDPTKIGKFGVGFKAVFAYTCSPVIKTGNLKFKISDLVVPEFIENIKEDSEFTHFTFPFNNSNKIKTAEEEVKQGLEKLDSTSLLFLKNINRIFIEINNEKTIEIKRESVDENFFKIILNDEVNYWYIFNKNISIKEDKLIIERNVSIAYAYNKNKIIPINGKVCIYFPCENEESKLKFHIHAPFASTVARDSVKDKPDNTILIEAIADLTAESLLIIKEKKLLTTEFLAVLPNSDDELDEFYSIVQNKILNKFHSENLLPMKNGGHGSTSGVFLPDNIIDSLLSEEDLVSLFNMYIKGYTYKSPIWVNNIHSSRVTTFYKNLNIKFFRFREYIEYIKLHKCINFFKSKDTNWHRKFYALLNEHDKGIEIAEGYFRTKTKYLAETHPIILLQNGNYEISENCYFSSEGVKENLDIKVVNVEVYSYRKDNDIELKEAQSARNYLDKANVKEIDEEVLIKLILDKRYKNDNFNQDINDLKKFITFAEKKKDKYNYEIYLKDFFKDYYIVKLADGKWGRPIDAYLDEPFIKTNLSLYYDNLSVNLRKYKINVEYLKITSKEKQVTFLKLIGVASDLEVIKINCPLEMHFGNVGHQTDINYTINGLEYLLTSKKDTNLSLFIWNKMNSLDVQYLQAKYSPNKKETTNKRDSTLVEILKKQEWIPINEDNIIKFVTPRKATKSTLVKSLVYDAKKEWLQRIEFGFDEKEYQEKQIIEKQNNEITKAQKEVIIKSRGFKNELEFNEAIDLGKKLKSSGKTQKELEEFLKPNPPKPFFPQNEAKDPQRRIKGIQQQLLNTTSIEFTEKNRSVRSSKGKIDPDKYLREFYTNESDIMVCQLCHNEMPFKKSNGEYYFEAVQIFKSSLLKYEHESQHIALCPVC